MDFETVLSCFPNADLNPDTSRLNQLVFDLPDNHQFAIDMANLTDREKCLVNLLLLKDKVTIVSPWDSYLQGHSPIPKPFKAIQLLQVHFWSEYEEESLKNWLTMMLHLVPNITDYFRVSKKGYAFVLEQSPFVEVEEVLCDTLATMEFDFGLKMTLFLGQVWPECVATSWHSLLYAEKKLFADWLQQYSQPRLLTFSQLYLYSVGYHSVISTCLATLLEHYQLEEIVLALWRKGNVLTKAAQSLYMHRNTLQYRIEKCYADTGLQLREMDNLAICYLVLLHRRF